MLISPLNAFPWVVNGLMEAWISMDRLEKYANLPTFTMLDYYDDDVDSGNLIENGIKYNFYYSSTTYDCYRLFAKSWT